MPNFYRALVLALAIGTSVGATAARRMPVETPYTLTEEAFLEYGVYSASNLAYTVKQGSLEAFHLAEPDIKYTPEEMLRIAKRLDNGDRVIDGEEMKKAIKVARERSWENFLNVLKHTHPARSDSLRKHGLIHVALDASNF